MAQNRCSQEEAFALLKAASSTRNIKLRAVAMTIVESLGQGPAKTHYEG
jgi:AmiR/NasT family two-component response regulator